MDTKSIWELLAGIPVGTIVAWIVVICAIIAALCTAAIKLYKLFTKYNKIKDENEKQRTLLNKHDDTLKEIKDSLREIKFSLEEQREVNLKQIRYQIVHTCDDALSLNEISAGKLRSLEEMYQEYTEIFHGNGYVKTLVERVRRLPIVGDLEG